MLAALRRGTVVEKLLLQHVVAEALPLVVPPMAGSAAAAAAAAAAGTCLLQHRPFSAAARSAKADQPEVGQHFVIASSTPVTKRLWQR